MSRFFLFFVACPAIFALNLGLCSGGSLFAQKKTEPVTFNQHIRPILSRHCTACHGPDEESRAADLRLDTFAGATADLGDYWAIVPGDPEESELIARITDSDDPMPPVEHSEMLSAEEVRLLRDWIQSGAEYERHWSFNKPQAQLPPSDQSWSKQPIDQFTFRAMQSQGLQPNEPADPARLIRRVALDLTGLPPTQAMVDRFVSSTDEKTYALIVDELLADPAFGEHWAAMWLDLARYADTIGYAGDEPRTIWPWRDWLIQALNENKPFDQFTYEVLAGDLISGATDQQILATAFHRNTLNNNEGGTSDEEFRTIAVKDRLSTTLNTWMGLTVRCAECHTHKYDPISHKEYYQLLDFFNQTQDADKPDERPTLPMSDELRQKVQQEIDLQIRLLRQLQKEKPVWRSPQPKKVLATFGTTLTVLDDQSVLATGANPKHEQFEIAFSASDLPSSIGGLRIEMLPDAYHNGKVGRGVGYGRKGAFVLTQVRVSAGNESSDQAIKLKEAHADFAQPGYGAEYLIRTGAVQQDDPHGWAVYHKSHQYRQPRSAIVSFDEPYDTSASEIVRVTLVFNSKWHHRNPGRFRISFTEIEEPVQRAKSNDLDSRQRQIDRLVRRRGWNLNVPVLGERSAEQLRATHVMKRGNYQNKEEQVDAATPSGFHSFPRYAPRNRLGIARWLMHEDNPLTARVAVNRYWARLFGKGIVVTEEDFGTQGTPPTHPELLDWLAIDFRQSGWDTKRLLRQIVMSKTYRQSSHASESKQKLDPKNVWLSRGPRVRLTAETLRDQALAVAGLLNRKMYGRPVFPPSPIYEMRNAFSATRYWDVSVGADRYRRGIYTYMKRSLPHPLFETFDQSTRAVCSLRRIETNTPLQSFMTLNDEAFVEAARALAMRMLEKPTADQQIEHGLKLALLRPANPKQVQTLSLLYQSTLKEYEAYPKQASTFLADDAAKYPKKQHPQIAALTVVANVILNLDEFLTH